MNNSRVFPEISCVWSDIFGTFVQMAGPYLYPCKIEYSLICAGKTDLKKIHKIHQTRIYMLLPYKNKIGKTHRILV